MQKKIFVLTGEPSGDKLAAKAVSKLKILLYRIEMSLLLTKICPYLSLCILTFEPKNSVATLL